MTDSGKQVAETMYERHTMLSNWLMYLGGDEKTAAEDACRIEHVVSKETFERLKATHKQSEKAVISSDES